MTQFEGKVMAITGAGSGIGRALAQNLAARGAQLALSDYNAAALAQIYPDLRIETAILWTKTARLMPLDPEIVSAALRRAAIP